MFVLSQYQTSPFGRKPSLTTRSAACRSRRSSASRCRIRRRIGQQGPLRREEELHAAPSRAESASCLSSMGREPVLWTGNPLEIRFYVRATPLTFQNFPLSSKRFNFNRSFEIPIRAGRICFHTTPVPERAPSARSLKDWGSMLFSSGLDLCQASATAQILWREARNIKKGHLISLFMACFCLKHAFEFQSFV
jgi:hypothetical protein